MKHAYLHILLVILLTMFGSKAFAYDIAVANDDGVTIYYNYINEETELEVTTQFPGTGGSGYGSLTSLTIPETVTYMGTSRKVTSIGYSTFHMCMDLTSITIPSSVTNIKRGAFAYCFELTSIKIMGGNAVYDSRENCNAIIETSSNTLIVGCKNTIIPNGVTSIGNDAFGACSGLSSLIIPDGVISIGDRAFGGCSGLNSVTIPSSVTSIGNRAFQSCSGLTDVYCYAKNVPTTNSDTFYGTSISDVTLHVPAASVDAYKAVAPWKDFKEVVALTDQETGIDVVSGDCDTEVARYTMGGQRVYRHAKGMNIIRMSNGKTKKMVVK